MKFISILSLITFLLIIVQCGQITSGLEDSKFIFSVTVKDPSDQPMEGLNISAWNRIQITGMINHPNQPIASSASTTIMFDLFDDAQVDLIIKNLRNEIVLNILDKAFFFPGRYSFIPSIQSQDGLAIYTCLLEIRDVKKHYLYFSDSTYMVLYQPDPTTAILGKTDYQGEYSTGDSLKFPNVLKNLPELIHTKAFSPEPQGGITIQDSITILVWDPQNLLYQQYHREIHSGKNHFELTWDFPESSLLPKNSMSLRKHHTEQTLYHAPLQISEWKLYQNYPNPFN